MNVKQLIEILKKLNPDMPVVMSKDGEGNYFSPLADTSKEFYVAHSSWEGELGDSLDGEPALILWPTN